MKLDLRAVDKETGEVVKVEKIAFWLGRPHIINDYAANGYRIEGEIDGSWVEVEVRFEGGV